MPYLQDYKRKRGTLGIPSVSNIHDGPREATDGVGGGQNVTSHTKERQSHCRAAVPVERREEEKKEGEEECEKGKFVIGEVSWLVRYPG